MEKAFLTRFEVSSKPGELVAVAYDGEEERGRTSLRTATGTVSLIAEADREVLRADDADLSYIAVSLRDATGRLVTDQDRAISVTVTGPGLLVGLGTGHPRSQESFHGSQCTSFDGRALAIVRPRALASSRSRWKPRVANRSRSLSASARSPLPLDVRDLKPTNNTLSYRDSPMRSRTSLGSRFFRCSVGKGVDHPHVRGCRRGTPFATWAILCSNDVLVLGTVSLQASVTRQTMAPPGHLALSSCG